MSRLADDLSFAACGACERAPEPRQHGAGVERCERTHAHLHVRSHFGSSAYTYAYIQTSIARSPSSSFAPCTMSALDEAIKAMKATMKAFETEGPAKPEMTRTLTAEGNSQNKFGFVDCHGTGIGGVDYIEHGLC